MNHFLKCVLIVFFFSQALWCTSSWAIKLLGCQASWLRRVPSPCRTLEVRTACQHQGSKMLMGCSAAPLSKCQSCSAVSLEALTNARINSASAFD